MKKFLIIGGGLAGVSISHWLYERNISFDLVDDLPEVNASKVAAGFWNPLVFRRLTMSYMADVLVPELKKFYSKVEDRLNTDLISKVPLFRVLASEEERRIFIDKALASEVQKFLSDEIVGSVDGIEAPYGLGRVLRTGNIDTRKYLRKSIQFFKENDSFINAKVDYKDISVKSDEIGWNNRHYERVIFCEGWWAAENPYFRELEFAPAKGEQIDLRIKGLEHCSFKGGVNLQPIGDEIFTVGSTYDWENFDNTTNMGKREELESKLKKFLKLDYEVIGHFAGVRPSSHDRRPYIGTSKSSENVHILNGFGTKGVMYAPYFSKMLLEHILEGKDLLEDVDIRRLG